ncbi:MAG: hypothetical protein GY936_20600 [Ignavibacteriae bacterium]|nr:hypothetical protein [Ignavibacteriota bacterium]
MSHNFKLVLILFLSISATNLFSQSNEQTKKGGICFRVDDNHEVSNFSDYATVFNRHGQKFTFALNLALQKFEEYSYIELIKGFQSDGHEMMDHTPNHHTNFFLTKFAPESYIGVNGIDKIIDNKICLKHINPDLSLAKNSGDADVHNNEISFDSNTFDSINEYKEIYIYLSGPEIDTLVLVENYSNNKAQITDLWDDDIDLGDHNGISFYTFTRSSVKLTIEAVSLLAGETNKLANLYELDPPQTWIQPGGDHPWLHKEQLKEALEGADISYVAGAVYPNIAKKVYNEDNPTDDLNFAMQWGDFFEDEDDLEYVKSAIAHNYALHHVSIGHSHFYSLEPLTNSADSLARWNDYLERTENIIVWADSNNIPIRTYTEWADILYNQTHDPYENIFPPLNVDLDENDLPDGYSNNDSYYIGSWEIDPDPETPSLEGYCYSVSGSKGIARVQDLGGIEKGKNNFEIWTKGESGSSIKVTFEYSFEHYNESISFEFPANTTNWTKYNLSQSINGNTELIVPDTMSTIFVYIECSDYTSGSVKISGMSLSKFGDPPPIHYLNVKIFLEGAYNITKGDMNNNLSVPLLSPYSIDPQEVNTISLNVVDWVLVELRDKDNSSIVLKSRSAFILNDGRIVDIDGESPVAFQIENDSYFIVLKHRNHLSVMSPNTIQLLNE